MKTVQHVVLLYKVMVKSKLNTYRISNSLQITQSCIQNTTIFSMVHDQNTGELNNKIDTC